MVGGFTDVVIEENFKSCEKMNNRYQRPLDKNQYNKDLDLFDED